ncbi:MAG: PhnD/SsuA/transferrin family substrate-binding protein [Oscillospiraceae bacterium]|nr:PhnD/SsuA/transferrin family substrate-binding protein [Oscillospiraceae bacterium]
MKKSSCFPAVLLALLLVGCANREAAPGAASSASEPAPPLKMDTLNVEVSRPDAAPEERMRAVRELPGALQAALAEAGVQVEEVRLTMGASPAATAQAVLEGGVDVAFLPAEALAELEESPRLILAAGGEEEGMPGQRMLLCAADTDYGRNLAAREDPTWRELDRARWGVLPADSLWGHRAVELWLADRYEGSGLGDLPDVTVYGDWEALLAAAAAGEVDLLPMTLALLEREEGSLTPIGETERLYTMAAVAGEGREGLASPLAEAVASLGEAALFGPDPYAPVGEEALDPQRRMAVLMG